MRRAIAAVLGAVLVLAAAPAPASAHALLEETSPERGAALDASPPEVRLRFSEPVEAAFGAVRVFDARAERVDQGGLRRPDGDATLGVRLREDLPDGTYVATYRVISADSHPVSGGFVFTVGDAAATGAPAVADLIGDDAGPVTEAAFGGARAVTYGATAAVVGVLVFLVLAWLPVEGAPVGAARRRARRLVLAASGAGVASGLAGIVLQGAAASGTTFWAALDPDVVGEVLDTRFGRVWLLRTAAFAAAGVAGAVALRDAAAAGQAASRPAAPTGADGSTERVFAGVPPGVPGAGAVLGAMAVVLVLAPALSGHAAASSPTALLVPLDVVHVVAMSVWLGGLAALLVVVPGATRALAAPQRSRRLAAVLSRFSPVALACVIALVATGVAQSLLHVDALDALWETAFGRAVLAKVALLAVLVALGAHQRRRVLPALRRRAEGGEPPGRPGRLLRDVLRAEVALAVVVLGVTAALVSYPPPDSLAAGPWSTTQRIGPHTLEVTLDPAAVGRNELHLYLLDARTGAPFDGTEELTVAATLPDRDIGPLDATPRRAGPGHYVVDGLQLVPAGTWRIEVVARVSEFEERRSTLEVEVG